MSGDRELFCRAPEHTIRMIEGVEGEMSVKRSIGYA
jgi:hypothetical protein